MARHNLRQNQGDMRSALRLPGVCTPLFIAAAVCAWRPAGGTFVDRIHWTYLQIASALSIGAGIWLAYVAIEPFARRRILEMLVTSSQLLQSRWRSPLIGKEILAGVRLGTLNSFLFQLIHACTWLNWSGASLNVARVLFLTGSQASFYAVMWRICGIPRTVVQYAVIYVVLVVVAKRKSLGAAIFFLCMLVVPSTRGSIRSALPIDSVIGGSSTWVLTKNGLVAAAAYVFTMNTLDRSVRPTRLNSWMVSPMALSLVLVSGLVAIGLLLATGKYNAFSLFHCLQECEQPLLGSPRIERRNMLRSAC